MAFFKGSYYENLPEFEAPEEGGTRFKGTRPRPIPTPEPVLEHGVATGDRLDQLAQEYYANPRDWRRLADCNADTLFAEDLIYDAKTGERASERMGEALLVPRRRDGAGGSR
ncbi:hypothetical protein ACS3SW_20320 [Roseobacteraceae bacterium S113]